MAIVPENPNNAERVLKVEGKRRSGYLPDVHPTLVSYFAQDGLTNREIAKRLHIGHSTLYKWKAQYPELEKALRDSKEIADARVEAALFKKALSGDVTACIFYLSNRRPDRWKRYGKETEVQAAEGKENAMRQAIKDALEGRYADRETDSIKREGAG